MDFNACNYSIFYNADDGSCIYAEEYYNCDGTCINDVDQDEVCDEIDNCKIHFNPNQDG